MRYKFVQNLSQQSGLSIAYIRVHLSIGTDANMAIDSRECLDWFGMKSFPIEVHGNKR